MKNSETEDNLPSAWEREEKYLHLSGGMGSIH